MIKRAFHLSESDVKRSAEKLKSGGWKKSKGPVKEIPNLDKIIVDNNPPPDASNAIGYVTSGSDDIHIVLPNLNKAVNKRFEQLKSHPNSRFKDVDISSLSYSQIENAKDDIKEEILDNIYEILAELFVHEATHLSGGETLKSESEAQAGGRSAVEKYRAANVIVELKKLAHQLDELGETSFVKDVFLIESMLPKEDVQPELPKKMAKKDLSLLQKDLEKLFTK